MFIALRRSLFVCTLGAASGLSVLALPGIARAGIPECNNVRLEDVANGACELRGSVECQGSCDRLGIYKKACATKLHQVCRTDCTFAAKADCTDSCTVQCKSECDRGVSITCQHNCFNECSGSCDGKCQGATDAAQCRATCEATCDGECDIQCQPVVDAPCYTHCIECCGGSCKAQANMDCQTTCQDEQFESCEHELEVNCSGSCSADGALFCNGQYIISGSDLPDCVKALIARGTLDAHAEGSVSLDSLGKSAGKAGCSLGARSDSGGAAGVLLAVILAWSRRARGRAGAQQRR